MEQTFEELLSSFI